MTERQNMRPDWQASPERSVPETTESSCASSSLASRSDDSVSKESKKKASSVILRPKPVPTTVRTPPAVFDRPEDILSHLVHTLTQHIFGLYGLELWHYNESCGELFSVPLDTCDEELGSKGTSTFFIKRVPQEADPKSKCARSESYDALAKLTNRSRNDFLPPKPMGPGVGLPGVLWAESSSGNGHFALHGMQHGLRSRDHHGQVSQHPIVWRQVDVLANDPDQPFDERLQAFAKAGFTLASGVPFDIQGYRGLVVFFGNPHAAPNKLRDPANSTFMRHTAQLIGATAALRLPMEQAMAYKSKLNNDNWRRLKIKMLCAVRFGGSLRNKVADQDATGADKGTFRRSKRMDLIRQMSSDLRGNLKDTVQEARASGNAKFGKWLMKVQGGSASIPPSFTFIQCFWTLIGVTTTHTILSRLNKFIIDESEGELLLVLAPLGALTTLQYNLTAAPASQPRNAIFAQVFALSTTLALNYIPNIDPWFRSALAPAIAITGMAKLGIIHPPAGAAAVVFSSGKLGWAHMIVFLAGVGISIITAVVINNLSDKRQYPTSWPLLNKLKKHAVVRI